MSFIEKGKVFVIVAPSGAGKSTLIKRIKKEFPQLIESISYTTRSKRPKDQDGVDYFFIKENEFLAMRDRDEFLEWAKVHSNYYGTSKKFVEEQLKKGCSILFDLDVQGADSFSVHFGDASKIIFISPPSLEILEERLIKRGTDSREVIAERLKNAKREILKKDDYHHCVTNEKIDLAFKELKEIFKKELGE